MTVHHLPIPAISDVELAKLKRALTQTTQRLEEANAQIKGLKKTVNALTIDNRGLESEVARLEAKGCCVVS